MLEVEKIIKTIRKSAPATLSADALGLALSDVDYMANNEGYNFPLYSKILSFASDVFYDLPEERQKTLFERVDEWRGLKEEPEKVAELLAEYFGKEERGADYVAALTYCLRFVDSHLEEIKEGEELEGSIIEIKQNLAAKEFELRTLKKFIVPTKKNGEEFASLTQALTQDREKTRLGYSSRPEFTEYKFQKQELRGVEIWALYTPEEGKAAGFKEMGSHSFTLHLDSSKDEHTAEEVREEAKNRIKQLGEYIKETREDLQTLKKIYEPYKKAVSKSWDYIRQFNHKSNADKMRKALDDKERLAK